MGTAEMTPGAGRAARGRHALALLFFVLATVVLTYPMVPRVADALPQHPDTLLNTWIIAWDVHALLHHPLHLFDANQFYPHRDTLAYSEHQLGSALLVLPIMLATGEPLIAVNLLLLFSFVVLGYGTYLLAYHHLRSVPGALVAGFAFAFAPFRFSHLSHVQLTTIQWLPFVFLFLARYLDTRRRADLVWFGGFYLLQMLTTMYVGAFMSVAIAAYLALEGRRRLPLRVYLGPLIAMTICVAAMTPVLLPYLALRQQSAMSRSETQNVRFSARPRDFVTPAPQQTLYHWLAVRHVPALAATWRREGGLTLMEHTLFPGLALAGLAALGAVVWRPGRRLWLPIAVGALVLALGPRQADVPMPYWLLYHGVPGFSGMRVPSRFALIGLFGMALLAGGGAAWLWRRPGRFSRAALAASLLVLAAEQVCLPVGLSAVPLLRHAPRVDQRLAGMAGRFPIVELPMGIYVKGEWDYSVPVPVTAWLYLSALHWKPLVNGYSGFYPSDYPGRVRLVNRFPLPDARKALADLGVRYAVVHPGGYPEVVRSLVMTQVMEMPGIEIYDDAVLVPISPEKR